ncbi:MAG TPA: hypothetical protein VGC39_11710, partial [Candidatus Methylacidiphilales bacterium]
MDGRRIGPAPKASGALAIQAALLGMLGGGMLFGQIIGKDPGGTLPTPSGTSLKIGVSTGGANVSQTAAGVEIPCSAARVVFAVTEDPGGKPNSCQLRFKLEGIDSDWVQREGDMAMIVFFRDASDQFVGTDRYPFVGKSKGWTGGKIDPAAFSHRVESFTIPPKVTDLRLAISSAGPPDAIGIL